MNVVETILVKTKWRDWSLFKIKIIDYGECLTENIPENHNKEVTVLSVSSV